MNETEAFLSALHSCCYCGSTSIVPSFVADHEREAHIDYGETEKACPHVAIRERDNRPKPVIRPQHDTSFTPEAQTRSQRF
jgi:hypothetical protein